MPRRNRKRRRRDMASFTATPIDPVTKNVILPGPPPGSYDPALDYQAGTAKRGYGYTQEDVQRQRERDALDLTLARTDIATGFQNLANSQAERQAASGVLSGGIAAQARQKRNTAEARQRLDLESSFARRNQDQNTELTRGGVELDEFLRGIEASKVYSSGFTPNSGLGGRGGKRGGRRRRKMARWKGSTLGGGANA